ncbi:MAG TPA: tRNA modification GTPase [Fimbriiglobus sp.]|jgi:tRNA modification GTPase|nr:tRNA modification GTPase [Fimbriiglobus sp.]
MTPHPDDTIVALSSAPGPGPRAIVRVTGPKTREVVAKAFVGQPASGGRQPPARRVLVPGIVRLTGVHAPLPADLYLWPAPHTYTGQDLAELHTISSSPLVERLIADLLATGARAARPGEFTLRAFLAGKKDLPRAEAVLAVIEAGTDADLRRALAQLAGGVTRPLERLREDLLNLLADVEAALDFADEDIEFVARPDVLTRVGAGIAHLTNLRRQLDDRAVSGRPVRVAIVGDPNAGKSSLFNTLAGSPAALVSDEAGTTRDYLTRALDLDGVPVELIDTAGWQHAHDTIAEQAQRLGREQAGRADVVLWCVPAGEPFNKVNEVTLAAAGAEVMRVWTKADTRHETRDTSSYSDLVSRVSCLVSVMTPGGTDALRVALTERVAALARPALAPSQSRCRGHVEAATQALRRAHEHALNDDPPELLALALREALEQIGEMAGTVHTDDLLDRIFSRFCIGK